MNCIAFNFVSIHPTIMHRYNSQRCDVTGSYTGGLVCAQLRQHRLLHVEQVVSRLRQRYGRAAHGPRSGAADEIYRSI